MHCNKIRSDLEYTRVPQEIAKSISIICSLDSRRFITPSLSQYMSFEYVYTQNREVFVLWHYSVLCEKIPVFVNFALMGFNFPSQK